MVCSLNISAATFYRRPESAGLAEGNASARPINTAILARKPYLELLSGTFAALGHLHAGLENRQAGGVKKFRYKLNGKTLPVVFKIKADAIYSVQTVF